LELQIALVDDPGNPAAECDLILAVLNSHSHRLANGAFLRVGANGMREAVD
jgi:hypothetical protein